MQNIALISTMPETCASLAIK